MQGDVRVEHGRARSVGARRRRPPASPGRRGRRRPRRARASRRSTTARASTSRGATEPSSRSSAASSRDDQARPVDLVVDDLHDDPRAVRQHPAPDLAVPQHPDAAGDRRRSDHLADPVPVLQRRAPARCRPRRGCRCGSGRPGRRTTRRAWPSGRCRRRRCTPGSRRPASTAPGSARAGPSRRPRSAGAGRGCRVARRAPRPGPASAPPRRRRAGGSGPRGRSCRRPGCRGARSRRRRRPRARPAPRRRRRPAGRPDPARARCSSSAPATARHSTARQLSRPPVLPPGHDARRADLPGERHALRVEPVEGLGERGGDGVGTGRRREVEHDLVGAVQPGRVGADLPRRHVERHRGREDHRQRGGQARRPPGSRRPCAPARTSRRRGRSTRSSARCGTGRTARRPGVDRSARWTRWCGQRGSWRGSTAVPPDRYRTAASSSGPTRPASAAARTTTVRVIRARRPPDGCDIVSP